MTAGLAGYYFIPAVRRGLTATITQDAAGERAALQAQFHVVADGPTSNERDFPAPVHLYGPGDILGFDPAIVTRTDPRPDVGDFEPNYFALVEFADPDFPWRFTAKQGTTTGLMPWITLVVLEAGEFDESGYKNSVKDKKDPDIPWFTVDVTKLPDLQYASRWAHAQVSSEASVVIDAAKLATLERDTPEAVVSRLVCPRHLKPGTAYSAFVVPTFKLGCVAAKRAPATLTDTALTPAWPRDSAPNVELPYYYRWDFHTGLRGDFEYLVRLLEPRKLTDLGKRPLNCANPGFGMLNKAGVLDLEGSLQSVGIQYTAWGTDRQPPVPEDLQTPLADLLNKPVIDLQPIELDVAVPVTTPPQFVSQVRASVSLSRTLNGLDVRLSWKTATATQCQVVGEPVSPVAPLTPLGTSHTWTVSTLRPGVPFVFRIQGGATLSEKLTLPMPPLSSMPLPTVVPPIYGHWYAGRPTVQPGGTGWLDQLNLDPRHRAAAGFGALVVEQQQEPLMASAWDQIGKIDEANEVLRRAQLGREASSAIHQRFGNMLADRMLLATRSVQHRLGAPAAWGGGKTTVAAHLEKGIPRSVLDPAFRRVQRSRGPLAKRQVPVAVATRPSLFNRLNTGAVVAAGAARDPEGMHGFYDVTELAAKPFNLVLLRSALIQPLPVQILPLLSGGSLLAPSVPAPPPPPPPVPVGQFHPVLITPTGVTAALADTRTLQGVAVPAGIDVTDAATAVSATLDGWLSASAPVVGATTPPIDLGAVATFVKTALNPKATIARRINKRLRLGAGLGRRADDLEQLIASPDFPQPMYEALRDLSQDLILPGVERVPQNTLAVLETNGRFVEAYLVALNHCFTGELLWRGAPVSGRSTYFRQFWDVEGMLPADDEILKIAEAKYAAATPDRQAKVAAEAERLERMYREPFKDIRPLHAWTSLALGEHDNRASAGKGEQLVLLVRGDLLRKYPNTLIYAVQAIGTKEQRDPGLPEFVKVGAPPAPAAIPPVFSGALPPDLTFFGFPFTAAEARGGTAKYPLGIYFVLEQRVSEARFGMDLANGSGPTLGGNAADPEDDWDNLSWAHFPTITEGKYVDGATAQGASAGLKPQWTDSAAIASITLQKPVRIAVHADQMLPPPPAPG